MTAPKKFPFSREEKERLAEKITEKFAEIQDRETEKAGYLRDIGGVIKGLNEELTKLNGLYRVGFETREVEVMVVYDKPEPGWKEIVVMGTSEVLETMLMTPEELQAKLDFSGEP